jgi:hypothetical protein
MPFAVETDLTRAAYWLGPNTSTKAQAVAYAETDPRAATLISLAAQYHWPVGFHDDLFLHDMTTLQSESGDMVFILREMGTHLFPVQNKAAHAWGRQVIDYNSGENKTNYYSPDDPSKPLFFHVLPSGDFQRITWRQAYALMG